MPPDFALDFSNSSLVTVFLSSDVAWGRIRSFFCRVRLSEDSSSNMSERKWQNTQKSAFSISVLTHVVVSRSMQNKCHIPSHILTCHSLKFYLYCVKLTFFARPCTSTEPATARCSMCCRTTVYWPWPVARSPSAPCRRKTLRALLTWGIHRVPFNQSQYI